MTKGVPQELEGVDLEERDTDDVNVVDILMGEVRKISDMQKWLQGELERIEQQLSSLARNMRVVYATQQEHGQKLASFERRCDDRRLESCPASEGGGRVGRRS